MARQIFMKLVQNIPQDDGSILLATVPKGEQWVIHDLKNGYIYYEKVEDANSNPSE